MQRSGRQATIVLLPGRATRCYYLRHRVRVVWEPQRLGRPPTNLCGAWRLGSATTRWARRLGAATPRSRLTTRFGLPHGRTTSIDARAAGHALTHAPLGHAFAGTIMGRWTSENICHRRTSTIESRLTFRMVGYKNYCLCCHVLLIHILTWSFCCNFLVYQIP